MFRPKSSKSKSKFKSKTTSKTTTGKSKASATTLGSSGSKKGSIAARSVPQASAPLPPKRCIPAPKPGIHVALAPTPAPAPIFTAAKAPAPKLSSFKVTRSLLGTMKTASRSATSATGPAIPATRPAVTLNGRDTTQVHQLGSTSSKHSASTPMLPHLSKSASQTKASATKPSSSAGRSKASETTPRSVLRTGLPRVTLHDPVAYYPPTQTASPRSKGRAPTVYYPQQKSVEGRAHQQVREHRSTSSHDDPVLYSPAFEQSISAPEPYYPKAADTAATCADSSRRGRWMPSFKPRIPKNPAPRPLPKGADIAGASSAAAGSCRGGPSELQQALLRTGPWRCLDIDCGHIHRASQKKDGSPVTSCERCCDLRQDGGDLNWKCCKCKCPDFGEIDRCSAPDGACPHTKCHTCRLTDKVPRGPPGENRNDEHKEEGPWLCSGCRGYHNRAKNTRFCKACCSKLKVDEAICDLLPWVCCECRRVHAGSQKECLHHSTKHQKCDECWLTISTIKVPKGLLAPFPVDEPAVLAGRIGRFLNLEAEDKFPEFEDLAEEAKRQGGAP